MKMANDSSTLTGRTLFIRNLPYGTTDESFEEFVSSIGPTKRSFVVKDRGSGKCRGFGYVTYADGNDAIKAKEQLKRFESRTVYVDFADPKHKKDRRKRKAPDEADTNVNSNSKLDSGDDDSDKETSHKKQKLQEPPQVHTNKEKKKIDKNKMKQIKAKKWRLIVRNLSFKCDENELQQVFSKFGPVTEVRIPTKPDGKKLGYAFVQLQSYVHACTAMKQMNAQPIKGRPVALDWVLSRENYQATKKQTQGKTATQTAEMENKESSEDHSDSEDEEAETLMKKTKKLQKVKEVVKAESSEESSEEEDGSDSEAEVDDEDEDIDDEDENDDDHSDESDENTDSDSESETGKKAQKKKLNAGKRPSRPSDVQEGRTLFIRNLSFDTLEEDLEDFCSEFGDLVYCKLVIDPQTEHPRGTAFVQFVNKEDADSFLAVSEDDIQKFTLDGRKINVTLAVDRDKAQQLKKDKVDKESEKDKRNLWLIREGLIRAGTQAAQDLSPADLAKRSKMELMKRQKLKNPNIFVSTTRLSVHNLPKSVTDQQLRQICLKAVQDKSARVTECRIMRDLKSINSKGIAKSLGYAFVNFSQHEHALKALRQLNNNAQVFGNKKKPIVEFSLENKVALEAKQKRLERTQTKQQTFKGKLSEGISPKPQPKPKSEVMKILAPVPVKQGEDRKKIPKGLPSHWGPKIRHKKRQQPPGKPNKKQKKTQKKMPAQNRKAVQPQKKRSKYVERRDTFDKLVDKYRQKLSSVVK